MKTPRALLFFSLAVAVVLAGVLLPVEDIMSSIQAWVISHPASAEFAVSASIVLGTLLLLPLSLMLMLSGFLFGLQKGFLVAWIAFLVASSAAFWIGKSAARPLVERQIQRKPLFRSIDRAIQRKGFLVVLLTRLVMFLPYPLLNYSLGLTQVSFRKSLLASGLGAIPVHFLFVYLGTTVSNLAAIMNGDVTLQENELMIGAFALLLVVGMVLMIIRIAGKTLKEELMNSSLAIKESRAKKL